MTTIRVASANIEWMNNWFTAGSGPAGWKATNSDDAGEYDPRAAADNAAGMIKAIDPDIIAVLEAPSRLEEMQLFIKDCLSDGGTALYKFVLGTTGGAQKIALLFKPGLEVALAPEADVKALSEKWDVDIEGTMQLTPYQFTRRPLVCDVTLGYDRLRIIAMHTKSNFVQNGAALWESDRQNYVVEALKNRRRISAEAMRVREFLDELVGKDLTSKVLLMGDLNDGPGRDYFEEHYLTHNVTDILLGSGFEPEFMFTHAQHDVPPADRYTCVFDDFVENVKNQRLFLDHIMLSPGLGMPTGLRKVAGSGRIHHTEWQQNTVGDAKRRDQRPSDHRPVSVELEYP